MYAIRFSLLRFIEHSGAYPSAMEFTSQPPVLSVFVADCSLLDPPLIIDDGPQAILLKRCVSDYDKVDQTCLTNNYLNAYSDTYGLRSGGRRFRDGGHRFSLKEQRYPLLFKQHTGNMNPFRVRPSPVAPVFNSVDCTAITDPTYLEQRLVFALDDYKNHVENIRTEQLNWANSRLPFLKDAIDAPLLAKAQRIIKHKEWTPRYEPFGEKRYEPGRPQDALHEIRDVILLHAAPLFAYSSTSRVREQITNHGLHVSGGAERIYQHQRGIFPVGPYGTTIPPYRQDISQAAMRREFFDVESSLPSIGTGPAVIQNPIPTNSWIMFIPTTGFSPKGHLVFSRLDVGFRETFEHYALATPHLSPGAFLPYDIVAFGNTLIPEEIPGTQIVRANTGELRVSITTTPEPPLALYEALDVHEADFFFVPFYAIGAKPYAGICVKRVSTRGSNQYVGIY
ncbi:uncharacterized protein LACBIDRAFT_330576 [Laccaria bicolor S238N-H82]|uniref:Predicted protein n=1 Tax=Laccaria bicolor (strain S238N-H82 / ATCC MYA-4686) TaxID=486041 RepID=B0DLR9_LACBS|nr:uncharacterized protein LACBIDRAFT_330576 [Laccaria bicolor S238N-H82]EDR04342.1 predicted protein [Laccaria bicolor S238N-H82]|eukprot:XP_001884861.1 predicted protein [Laccaria bicolor S238N-H82]